MLSIICGQDTVASRLYFSRLQQEKKKQGLYLEKISASQIEDILKNGETTTLFNEKKIYIVENLTSYTARKKSKDFSNFMEDLLKSTDIEVYDWEQKTAREIKLKYSSIEEFKPSENIFQLQEACTPGKLVLFSRLLNQVSATEDEGFVFVMLCRHIRTLLLVKTDQISTMPFWMKKKLASQADRWTLEGLTGFYEGLARIDSSIKTSSFFGIKKSLELLACYFLK